MAVEQTLKKDWYSILGADPSANVSDLKQKYQKLILLDSFLLEKNYFAGKLHAAVRVCPTTLRKIHVTCGWSVGNALSVVRYHPDKQSADVPAGTLEECMQKFIEIDQAWKILGNEETKKQYDLQRHEDELRNVGPVDTQVHLEEMVWNKDDESFSLSCRCGGKYTVYKDEAEEVNLISCDTCSLIVELLHQS